MAYNFNYRSPSNRSLAIACVGGITLAVGAMYYAQTKSKEKEGQKSIYKEGGLQESDSRMNSSDVSAAVSSPKIGRK